MIVVALPSSVCQTAGASCALASDSGGLLKLSSELVGGDKLSTGTGDGVIGSSVGDGLITSAGVSCGETVGSTVFSAAG